ncbi:MAG TPA: replication-relaxation family protein [Actinoplanes sp.]|nr:replication-relaxation family protein [Actinoplanes sp.]
MDDPVLRVQSQLTDRDRVLLGWLYDHGVLTTFQISHALFGSLDFCQRRLLALYRLRLIARFRPQRADGGSYPYHYVINQLGAEVVAASRDERRVVGSSPTRRTLYMVLDLVFSSPGRGHFRYGAVGRDARWLLGSRWISRRGHGFAKSSADRVPRPVRAN